MKALVAPVARSRELYTVAVLAAVFALAAGRGAKGAAAGLTLLSSYMAGGMLAAVALVSYHRFPGGLPEYLATALPPRRLAAYMAAGAVAAAASVAAVETPVIAAAARLLGVELEPATLLAAAAAAPGAGALVAATQLLAAGQPAGTLLVVLLALPLAAKQLAASLPGRLVPALSAATWGLALAATLAAATRSEEKLRRRLARLAARI